jgi:hypothetical protein
VNEAFNPYREWLGLDSHIEAPNYYELLGLPQFEGDAARLLAAADRALVRVRGFRPGAQAAAWARLLDELAAAKRCLCDPQLKTAYDQSLRSGAAPTEERRRVTTERIPEVAAVNLSPDLYPPGMAPQMAPRMAPRAESVAAPSSPVGSADRSTSPASAANTKPKGHGALDDRSADRAMAKPAPRNVATPQAEVHNPVPPGMTASGMTASGLARPKSAMGHALPPGQPPEQPHGAGETSLVRGREDSPESEAVHAPAPPGPVNAHVAPPRKEPVSLLPMVAIVTTVVVIVTVIILVIALHDEQGGSPLVPQSPSPAPATDTPQPKLGPFQPTVTNIIPAPNGGKRPAVASPSKPAPTMPPGTAPMPPGTALATENDDPSATDGDVTVPMVSDAEETVTPDPVVVTPDPAAANPEPVVATPDPVAATPAELKQLGQLLNRARSALSQHEFVESRRLVEQAGQLAKSDEHVALVDRLRMLAELAEQFWSGVATATRKLQATQEIKVGSGDLIVVVVETGPDWLTIRNQGRNTRYLVAEMPPGLALAIARQSMNEDDPQTQLLFGAGLATVKDLKPAHLEEARRYWERAAAAGADAAPLQAALTDNYELGE